MGEEQAKSSADGELADAIVKTVRAPLLVLDESLEVRKVNPAFCSVLAVEADTLLGRTLDEIVDGRWNVAELRELLADVFRDGGELREFPVRARLADRRESFILLSAQPLPLAGSAPLVLLSLQDRSDEERLERDRRKHTLELERSNRELEDFAHAASHDLQEPLRKIGIYSAQLPGLLGEDIDPRVERSLTRLAGAVKRMRSRVDDLLQLARVSRTPPARTRTDLGRPVSQALRDLSVAIRELGAKVDVEDLGEADVDPEQMRMLFQNLINNALKFAKAGQPPTVRITAAPAESSQVRIMVEDDGIGFDDAFKHKIFEPFQRLHTRIEYEGSGIGLAVCRRIMEHHHGSIHAEGRPGIGARFVVEFPRHAEEER